MLRKEQNTAQRAKNNAVILLSGEEKPQSANVGMLGETFYISSIPSEHNKKIANEQWQNGLSFFSFCFPDVFNTPD